MDERAQRIQVFFDRAVLVAALVSIPVLILEESQFAEPWATVTSVLNWIVWPQDESALERRAQRG